MKSQIPRTPFSTGLSGSAREVELRLRNIFSGPKKRPPLPFLFLMFAACLLCGNLVSCQNKPAVPTVVMETQYYDRYNNLIEIPALALPAGEKNDAVDAINAALNGLRQEYSDLASRTDTDAWDNHCLFYPSTTGRYLNLLFFRSQFVTDLNTGHVFSLVYDLKGGTQVSAEDALALAGLNEKGLLDQVAEQVRPELDRGLQEHGIELALHNLTLEGFRVKADGQPVFYLTGRVDDVDDAVHDAVSGADHLYIWEDRAVSTYEGEYGDPFLLVPAEETDKLDPPLWNQWYFAGEEPENGYSPAPAGASGDPSEAWTPVELGNHIIISSSNFLYEYLTGAEAARLENIPAAELPREAVELYPGPFRGDFWEDMLLPVAYDEASDVTVYFVFGNMPAGTYRDIHINLFGAPNLKPDGIVLRWGGRAEYFPLNWYANIKYRSNPPLLVDDLDGDGQPEAALSLACSDGTGVYAECLYLFDLDTMTYTVPDYSDIPLELKLSPDGSTVKLQSGAQSLEVDVTELGERFFGRVDVGNQVRFRFDGGRIFCELALDFSCDTLGYLAEATFPVVCEDGAYRLGPAEILTGNMLDK